MLEVGHVLPFQDLPSIPPFPPCDSLKGNGEGERAGTAAFHGSYYLADSDPHALFKPAG